MVQLSGAKVVSENDPATQIKTLSSWDASAPLNESFTAAEFAAVAKELLGEYRPRAEIIIDARRGFVLGTGPAPPPCATRMLPDSASRRTRRRWART